jgi:Tol biopolymer transport system component/DNA-binding winged helix-turn-helix (wHTH) protein
VYEFGPFRLDIAEKLLWRDGTMVPLEPTQFQVLTVLVRSGGRLLTREELTQTVWKDTHVDEGSLTVTISVLRRKLGDTPSQPRFIETVRKSGYRFVAPVTLPSSPSCVVDAASSTEQPAPAMARRSHRAGVLLRLSFALVVVLVGVFGWYSPRSGVISGPTPAPVLLHPFGGNQDDPSFSPDGRQTVFSWRPPESDNYDIYILMVGDLEATRLTTHPAWDRSPAWSPDGRQIAFIRSEGSRGELLLISPAGGPEQKVDETAGTSVTWSSDSKTLAFTDRAATEDSQSIFVVPAAGGTKRRVTFPAGEKTYGDSSPAISSDGRILAFVRHLTYDVADIFVQPLDGAKAARQLTFDKRQIRGLAWMAGREELIFSSNRSGRHRLWRVKVSGTTQPTLVEGITDARFPAVSGARAGSGSRLVYQAQTEDYNIRLLNRAGVGAWNASAPLTFAVSVRDEQSPRVSPDRRRLAFVSDRSGWFEVWVCAYPEASGCRQLTSLQRGYVGSPSWSPDSQRIVFDARVDGNADIYVIRADGGQPVRITYESSVESRASWSGDGRWIYFRSDRTGAHQIWKMPLTGGTPVQVTRNGGFDALESSDGKLLYYVQGRYTWGLWSVAVEGGREARVPRTGAVTASSWAVVNDGILWIDITASNPPGAIRFYDLATREVSKVADVTGYVIPSATGFSATHDGSIVMWSQMDRSAHDLMVVERFR